MKNKKLYCILLLLTFCFSNITLGGFAFSKGIVYLHKNHVHFYTYDKSNELAETDREDRDSIVSFNLVALKSTDLKNRELLLTQLSDSQLIPSESSIVFNNTNKYSLLLVTSDDKNPCKTKLFLQYSSYLI